MTAVNMLCRFQIILNFVRMIGSYSCLQIWSVLVVVYRRKTKWKSGNSKNTDHFHPIMQRVQLNVPFNGEQVSQKMTMYTSLYSSHNFTPHNHPK